MTKKCTQWQLQQHVTVITANMSIKLQIISNICCCFPTWKWKRHRCQQRGSWCSQQVPSRRGHCSSLSPWIGVPLASGIGLQPDHWLCRIWHPSAVVLGHTWQRCLRDPSWCEHTVGMAEDVVESSHRSVHIHTLRRKHLLLSAMPATVYSCIHSSTCLYKWTYR